MHLGANVYVAPVNQEVLIEAIKITQMLRREGLSTVIDMMGRRLGKQFEYADKKNIPNVVIVGERELAEESVTLRNMKTGEQKKVKISELVNVLG